MSQKAPTAKAFSGRVFPRIFCSQTALTLLTTLVLILERPALEMQSLLESTDIRMAGNAGSSELVIIGVSPGMSDNSPTPIPTPALMALKTAKLDSEVNRISDAIPANCKDWTETSRHIQPSGKCTNGIGCPALISLASPIQCSSSRLMYSECSMIRASGTATTAISSRPWSTSSINNADVLQTSFILRSGFDRDRAFTIPCRKKST